MRSPSERPQSRQKSTLGALQGRKVRMDPTAIGSRVPSLSCGVHQKSTLEPDMSPKYTILAFLWEPKIDEQIDAKIDAKKVMKNDEKMMPKVINI